MKNCKLSILAYLAITGCATTNPVPSTPSYPINNDGYYYINTRIVIPSDHSLSTQRYVEFILNAEQVFSPLNIRFYISTISVYNENYTVKECVADSLKYNNILSIYFMPIMQRQEMDIDGVNFRITGLTSYPFTDNNSIIIDHNFAYRFTLAHEFGHWGGNLLHPFQEDFVEDTPDTNGLINIDDCNIMNYHMCDNVYITPGQLKRFELHFFCYRKNYLIQPPNKE